MRDMNAEILQLAGKMEEVYASLKMLKITINNTYPDAKYDDVLVFAAHKIIDQEAELKYLRRIVEERNGSS